VCHELSTIHQRKQRQKAAVWLIALPGSWAVCLALWSCAAKGNKGVDLSKREESTAAATSDTTVKTGDVARVTIINWQSAAQNLPWGVAGVGAMTAGYSGWRGRRYRQALDRVVEAIERKQCVECKACVRASADDAVERTVNRRVKRVTRKAA